MDMEDERVGPLDDELPDQLLLVLVGLRLHVCGLHWLLREGSLNQLAQAGTRERLEQDIHYHAPRRCPELDCGLGQPGDHQHRDLGCFRSALQPPQHLLPGQIGQLEGKQDEVGAVGGLQKGRASIGCQDCRVSGLA